VRQARAAGLPPVEALLAAPTSPRWVELACARLPELLQDHADAEKKAASTAISLMFLYADDTELAGQLSKLAREELRHYEQVARLMRSLGIGAQRRRAGRYAAGLRAATARSEPRRKLDLLLVGALIEGRSCERFRLLAPALPAPVAELYRTLERAEARHYEVYLRFAEAAQRAQPALDWRARLTELAVIEAELATAPDDAFCFHSGTPAGSTGAA
jgi:tRNA 2-(methylsulfanyl)-N6-isopentenyladenosine37 hydroxylase